MGGLRFPPLPLNSANTPRSRRWTWVSHATKALWSRHSPASNSLSNTQLSRLPAKSLLSSEKWFINPGRLPCLEVSTCCKNKTPASSRKRKRTHTPGQRLPRRFPHTSSQPCTYGNQPRTRVRDTHTCITHAHACLPPLCELSSTLRASISAQLLQLPFFTRCFTRPVHRDLFKCLTLRPSRCWR